MKAWKWITIIGLFVLMYIFLFTLANGWILAIIFGIIIITLCLIPQGGTLVEAIKLFMKDLKQQKAEEKILNEKLEDENTTFTQLVYSSNSVKPKVALGLSGGVDSAVSAYLLQKQGYEVIAFFMKNWNRKLNNELNSLGESICQNDLDYQDAQMVAKQLNIPLHFVDFSAEYWNEVFEPFLEQLKTGYTPNPDVLCNKNIKFKVLTDYVKTNFPDIQYFATGHYANVIKKGNNYYLKQAKNNQKDQTYFLAQIDKEIIPYLIFPLGNFATKNEIREIAKQQNLVVASKHDSMGICFIGNRQFDKFLENWIKPEPGNIVDFETKKILGKHKGVIFYTIGQNKGLGLGGQEEKHFVVKKDVKNNILYVATGNEDILFTNQIKANKINWLIPDSKIPKIGTNVEIKTRHSTILNPAFIKSLENGTIIVETFDEQKAITPGQELVIYRNKIVICGAQIIEND